MNRRFYGSINVQNIDKTKLVKGEKGLYSNVVVWVNDEADEFGNKMSIQLAQSKEEADAGVDKIYLGNLKESESKVKMATEDDTKDLW